MSYYVSVSGWITFDRVLDKSETDSIIKILDDTFETVDPGTYTLSDGVDRTIIDVYNYGNCMYGDDIEFILSNIYNITPAGLYDGEFVLRGEDDYHWRYVYKKGRWVEEDGEITYGLSRSEIKKVLMDKLQDISYAFDDFAGSLESDSDFWSAWSEMQKFISEEM